MAAAVRDPETGKFVATPPAAPPAPPASPAIPPPAAPAAPAAPEPRSRKPADEAIRDFGDHFGYSAEQFKKESDLLTKPKPPATHATPEPPKKAPKPVAKPVAKPDPSRYDREAVVEAARIAAREATLAVNREAQPPVSGTPTPSPDPLADLSEDERDTILTLREMESIYPDKYKGLAEKYTKGQHIIREYVKNWERDNPDQPFDEEDPEHDAFYAEHDVEYENAHFRAAERSLWTKQAEERLMQKLSPKLEEIDQREALRMSSGIIADSVNDSAKSFWSALGDEYKEVIKEDGTVNREALNRISDADPMAFEVLADHATRLESEVGELRKLMIIEGHKAPLAKFNPQNPLHVQLGQFTSNLERRLMLLPEAKRKDGNGRMFLPAEKYYSQTDREGFWTLGFNDIRDAIVHHYQKSAKSMLDRLERGFQARMKHRGLVQPPGGAGNGKPPAQPHEREVKPTGPGSTTGTRLAESMRSPGGVSKENEHPFVRDFLGR